MPKLSHSKIFTNTLSATLASNETVAWNGTTKGSLWGYRFFIGLIRLFGISAAYIFAVFVVAYYICFSPRTTRTIYHYFRKRHHFGRWKSALMTYRNFYCFAQVLIDKIAIPSGFAKGFSDQYENVAEARQMLDGEQSCVLISAHVGNWDIAGSFFGEYGSRLHIILLDAEHQRIKRLLDGLPGNKAYRMIALQHDMSHIFEIGNALRNKEHLCFQGDRYLPGTSTLCLDFLGAPAIFPAGPFQIAARNHSPVIFFFAMKERGRTYRFHFYKADIDVSASKKELEISIASQYIQALEKIVRRYPAQWFNFYEFWK